MRSAVLAAWLLLLAALTALAACGRDPAPSAPASQSDAPRIVALSPALAVVLCDLGLRERIVGRHGYDLVLDPAVPVCGQQSGIVYEALLRAEPTHVLTEWGARELPQRLVAIADEHAWTLRDFRMLTLEDIDAAADALGEMFPEAEASARVERLGELSATHAPEPAWQGRVLLLMSVSPIGAIGPGSAHHELLVRVGGVPAIAEGSPYMRLHAEDVLRMAPDAIILLRPRSSGAAPEPSPDLGAIAELDIPAVRLGRVAVIDHPLGLVPSTALADVADEMEPLLERWAEQ